MQSPKLQTGGKRGGHRTAGRATFAAPKVNSKQLIKKKKRNPTSSPAPQEDALCDWAARVPLKGTESRKGARLQAKPPHARGLW